MIYFLLASDSHLLESWVPPHLFQTGMCMAFQCYEIICSTSYMPEETGMASASFHLLAFFIFFLFYQIAQVVNSCCSEEVQIFETILDFKCFNKCVGCGIISPLKHNFSDLLL